MASDVGLRFDAQQWLAISLAIIVASGIVIWMLQRKGAGGFQAIFWRWLAVSCLAITIAKPVVLRSAATGGGEWIILLDQSRSMSVNDPQRSPARCVALAQAAGSLQAEARPLVGVDLINQARALTKLQDALEAVGSELDFAELSGHGVNAAFQRLNDSLLGLRVAAEQLEQKATDQPNAVQLFDICRAIIQQIDAISSEKHPEKTSGIGNRMTWLPALRRLVNSATPAAEQPQEASDAAAYRSDPDVRAAADQVANSSRIANASHAISQLIANRPSGVGIAIYGADPSLPPLSIGPDAAAAADGDTTDTNGAIAAMEKTDRIGNARAIFLFSDGRQIGARSALPPVDLPIIAVNCGVPAAIDVWLAGAELPAVALVHEAISVRVAVEARGVRDATMSLEISDSADKWAQTINYSEGRTVATLPLRFETAGMHELVITANSASPEPHRQNNTIRRWIRVVDQNTRVSLIPGAASEDLTALANALRQTSWIDPQSFVAGHAPPEVVILHDVQPKSLNASQWVELTQRVKDGGGLILVAGPDTAPAAFGDSAAKLLFPWRGDAPPQWRSWPMESGGFHLAAAEGSIITRFSDSPAENRKQWEQLPAVRRILPIEPSAQNIQPLLLDTSSEQPVVTEQRLGAGRIIFVGFSEAYRWQNQFGDQDADHFWLSLIRRVTEPPYAVRNDEFALDAEPSICSSGKPINIRVKALDASHGMPTLQLLKGDTLVQDVPLRPLSSGEKTGRLVGTLTLAAIGDYQLRLQGGRRLQIPLRIEANDEAEMMNLNPDDEYLRRIARASGGEYLRLDELSLLPQRVEEMLARSPRMNVVTLWDSAAIYWIVLGCLTLDWVSRKRAGQF